MKTHQKIFIRNLYKTLESQPYTKVRANGGIHNVKPILDILQLSMAHSTVISDFQRIFLNDIIKSGTVLFVNDKHMKYSIPKKIQTKGKLVGKIVE